MLSTIQKTSGSLLMKIKTTLSANPLYQSLLIGIIFITAVSVRIWALFHVGDFAWDEMFSFYYAQKPWGELGKIMLWETNPPLHLFFLKNYFYLFPATEFWARLPSALIGIVSLPLIYHWTKKLFSHRTALLATIILAFHPFAIYASTLNRVYSALILLGTISYYYYQKIFFGAETKNSKRDTTFFIIIQFFLFFSHLTFGFIVLAQLLTLIIFARKKIKKYILLNLAPGLIWLIWFLPSWYLKIKTPHIGDAWFLNIGKSANPLASIASIFSNTPYVWLNIFFLCLIIIGIGKIIYEQTKSRQADLNFWIISIPVLLTIVIVFLGNLWQAKFFMIVLPLFAVFTAYTLEKVLTKNILPVTIVILAFLEFFFWAPTLPTNDWTRINNYLQEQSSPNTKQVLIDNNFVNWIYFPRYYAAPQTHLIYRPSQTDWDELIVKQNYRYYQRPIEPIIDWLKKAGRRYDEIIIYQDYSIGVDLNQAAKKIGWRQKNIFPLDTGLIKKDIIIYAKPETVKN